MEYELITPVVLAPMGAPRSTGIHVSTVIRNIAVLNKTLKREYLDSLDLIDRDQAGWWDNLDHEAQLRMSMGLAWEDYYVRQILRDREVVHQPGEMCVEGIYMTHDGEALETIISERNTKKTVIALHEVKLTYKSWNTIKKILHNWMWLAQMKAYCKGLGTLVAYLHVLCVVGDYSYPLAPLLRIFRIEFTQREIDDNWDIITGFVRHRQQQEAEDMMRDTV